MKNFSATSIDGRFWLLKGKEDFLGHGRIELLQKIKEYGSISKAARAMKMSYRAAWDVIEAISSLADAPVVNRISGGVGGGGTELTELGDQIIALYTTIDQEHKRFIKRTNEQIENSRKLKSFIKRCTLITSQRNQFECRIAGWKRKDAVVQVNLILCGDIKISAALSAGNYNQPGLRKNKEIRAVIMESAIRISLTNKNTRDENVLSGKVIRINRGRLSVEITVAISEDDNIVIALADTGIQKLGLEKDSEVFAHFPPEAVILGV